MLTRYTGSEASTIARSVAELDRVEALARLHAKYHKRTLGPEAHSERNVSACTPSPRKMWAKGGLAIMPWEETWKAMTPEHRSDVKIPDLWRMSALACTTNVKEHMLREDEVGENNEKLKAKVVSYKTNTAYQTRSTERDGGADGS